MQEKPFEIQHPNLLLVEGKDDKWLLDQLLSQLGIQDVQTHWVESKDKFAAFLRLLPKRVNEFELLRTISLVVDADESRSKTFAELLSALRDSALPVPVEVGKFGPGVPSVLIECIPPGEASGTLEDLLLPAMEALIGEMRCWPDFRQCLGREMERSKSFNEARWNKIKLQLILNCSDRAFHKGIINAFQSREYRDILQSPYLEPLRELLRKVHAEGDRRRDGR